MIWPPLAILAQSPRDKFINLATLGGPSALLALRGINYTVHSEYFIYTGEVEVKSKIVKSKNLYWTLNLHEIKLFFS